MGTAVSMEAGVGVAARVTLAKVSGDLVPRILPSALGPGVGVIEPKANAGLRSPTRYTVGMIVSGVFIFNMGWFAGWTAMGRASQF